MVNRTQTWSTVSKGKITQVPPKQIKSFKTYRLELAAQKLADKIYIDNLFTQLIEAKQQLANLTPVPARLPARQTDDEAKKEVKELIKRYLNLYKRQRNLLKRSN